MFKYQADFWDEVDQVSKTEQGLIAAADYGEAAEKVVTYYGKSNIVSIYLEEWDDVLTEDEVLEGFQSWQETVHGD